MKNNLHLAPTTQESRPVFLSIPEAARQSGLSSFFIRNGCKDGSIPHIMCGTKYLVNYQRMIEKFDAPFENGMEV